MFSSLTNYLWGSNSPQPSDESNNDLYDSLNSDFVNDFVDDLSAMEIGSSDEEEPEVEGKRTTKNNEEWIFIDDEKLGLRRVKKNDTWFKVQRRNFVKPLPRNHIMKKYGRRFNSLYQNTDRKAYAKYCKEQNKLDPNVTFADKVKAWQMEDKNSGEQIPEVKKPIRPKKIRARPVSLTDDTKERIRQSVKSPQNVEYDWRSVSRVKATKRDTHTNTNFNSKKKMVIVDPKPELTVTDDDIEKYLKKKENEMSILKSMGNSVVVPAYPIKPYFLPSKARKEKPTVIQKKITTPKSTKSVSPTLSPTQKKITLPQCPYSGFFSIRPESYLDPNQVVQPKPISDLNNRTQWSQFCANNLWPFRFSAKSDFMRSYDYSDELKQLRAPMKEKEPKKNVPEYTATERVQTRSELMNRLLDQEKRLLAHRIDSEDNNSLNEKRFTLMKKFMFDHEEPQIRKKKTSKETETVNMPRMFEDNTDHQSDKERRKQENAIVSRTVEMNQKGRKREERKKMTRKSMNSANRARAAASAGNGRPRRADRMNHTVCARSNNNRKIH